MGPDTEELSRWVKWKSHHQRCWRKGEGFEEQMFSKRERASLVLETWHWCWAWSQWFRHKDSPSLNGSMGLWKEANSSSCLCWKADTHLPSRPGDRDTQSSQLGRMVLWSLQTSVIRVQKHSLSGSATVKSRWNFSSTQRQRVAWTQYKNLWVALGTVDEEIVSTLSQFSTQQAGRDACTQHTDDKPMPEFRAC